MPIRGDTAASDIVSITIYGIVLAKVTEWIDKRYVVKS
jgi:hypothetical protein